MLGMAAKAPRGMWLCAGLVRALAQPWETQSSYFGFLLSLNMNRIRIGLPLYEQIETLETYEWIRLEKLVCNQFVRPELL